VVERGWGGRTNNNAHVALLYSRLEGKLSLDEKGYRAVALGGGERLKNDLSRAKIGHRAGFVRDRLMLARTL